MIPRLRNVAIDCNDLDVGPDDLEPAIARAERLGARRVESSVEDGYGWWVLADPEGNPFCIGRSSD